MNHDDSIRIAIGIELGYITGHYISLPHASAVEHAVPIASAVNGVEVPSGPQGGFCLQLTHLTEVHMQCWS